MWDQLKVFAGKTKQNTKPTTKTKQTKKTDQQQWNVKKSPSQATHCRNIGCIGCYRHADRSTSLSCLENVNKHNKAEVICRNLGRDKDLWALKKWIPKHLASNHIVYTETTSRRRKKLTRWNSNNLEIKGNFWLKWNLRKKMNAIIL